MASASKAIRQKRRIRRNLSLFRRMYQKEALDRIKVTTVLLSILQQAGGEIELSQATINQTVQQLGKVQYIVEKKNLDVEPFDGQFVVRLVTSTEPAKAEDVPVVEPLREAQTEEFDHDRSEFGGQELEQ